MAEGPFHSHERFVQKTFQVEDEGKQSQSNLNVS